MPIRQYVHSCAARANARRFSTGVSKKWSDADRMPAGVRPLLLAANDAPRVLVPQRGPISLDDEARGFLETVQNCLPALLATAQRTESLHRLAITDHLTGAYNRRYFYHVTDRILRRADAGNYRAMLFLYDIDNFKRYNDTYGHGAGDEILRETAKLMRQTSRTQDIVARIGGDEFAVLFWDPENPRRHDSQPLRDAFALAVRFRKAVCEHSFASLGPEATGALTISGGMARFPGDGPTCRELLRKADRALKEAKNGGKNVIRLVGRDA